MFKRYKIRKAKKFNDIKVTTKHIKHNSEYIEKTELQKIKILLTNNNKSNAYKRILKLTQDEFDKYLFYITINVMSEYIETDDTLLFGCVRRILNSKKFYAIEDSFRKYVDGILDKKFHALVKKCQKKFYNKFIDKNDILDLGCFDYDGKIIICLNPNV